jgi:hypothetical protein
MVKIIDIRKMFAGSGYRIEDSAHDTTNIVCRRGSVYADGEFLVASMDAATPAESRALRKFGEPVADGDFGELSVRFPPERFREVARLMLPRQADNFTLAV